MYKQKRFQLYNVYGVVDRTYATSLKNAKNYFKKSWNIERLGGSLQWNVFEGGDIYIDNYDAGVINKVSYRECIL